MAHLKKVLETGKEARYEYALTLNEKLSHFESRMVKSGQDEVLTINRDITERKQSEVRDSAFLQDMKALQEIFLELSQINDLQTLYSGMVRLTQERLKIDRVAIFLIDHNTNELVGTYGVDTDGKIRDESYYRDAITANHWTLPILNSPKHTAFWEETPIFDNGIQVGIGWITTTTLWDGKEAIGYLVTDNHIHHQTARPYQDELSSLLGSTYGHLIRLKQTQLNLRQSEERQRALLAAIPDLMFRFDRNGKFLDFHSSDPKNLALPPEAFLGRNIRDVMPPDVAALQAYHMKKVLQTGQEAIYEYTLERDGQPGFFEARMVVSGKDEVLAIIRDITERKVLEEQAYALVVETARANVLGQFVQNASHELRTPLSTINTALYLMTKTDDADKRQVYSDRAAAHIQQLSRLLDMVLSMTKLDSTSSLNIELIDLNDWVRRVVSVSQEQSAPKELTFTIIPDAQ
jgi:PAS domain S-box-containing protein